MFVNTWINNELITIDVEDAWGEVFAHWDALVPTDTAERIANAVCAELEAIADEH